MLTHPSPPPCAQLFGFRAEGHGTQREGRLCDGLWCSLGLFCLDLYTNLARGLQVGVDRRWPPQAPADEKLHSNSSLLRMVMLGGAASQPATPIIASEVHISLYLHGQGLIYPLLAHLGS